MAFFASLFMPLAVFLYIGLIGWRLTQYFAPLSREKGLSVAVAPLLGILALTPLLFLFVCILATLLPGDKAFTASLLVFLVLALIYEVTHILRHPRSNALSWEKILHGLTSSIRQNVPLLVFSVIALGLTAYQFITALHLKDGELFMGGAMWSDVSLHLGVMQSFALGGNYPPENFAFPGTFLNHHFLYYFVVAVFVKLGADPIHALNFTAVYFFTLIAVLSYYFGQSFFKSGWVGIAAFLFLCFGSSLAFYNEVFVKHTDLQSLINLQGWLVNTTSESWGIFTFNVFINQRHFPLGLAAFLFCAYLLFSYSLDGASKRESVGLGLAIGVTPFFHMSVALSLVLLAGSLFLLSSHRRALLLTNLVALGMLIPQIILWKLGNDNSLEGYPKFHLGYDTQELSVVTFVVYYAKVLGLKIVLFVLGYLMCEKRMRLLFWAAFPLFILPNVLQMSKVLYDNNKFIILWMLIANLFAALPVVYLWQKTLWHKSAAAFLLVIVCANGIVDYFGVTRIGRAIVPYAKDGLREWVENHTGPRSVFLADYRISPDYRPFFSVQMAGRRLYVHEAVSTIRDVTERKAITKQIFESSDKSAICRLTAKENIDYILLDPGLPGRLEIAAIAFPVDQFKVVFNRNEVKVVAVQDSCQSAPPVPPGT